MPGEVRRARSSTASVAASTAIELIDIDAGASLWRDTTAARAPVVGVTDDAIVCADAKGTRGVGLDGKSKWTSERDVHRDDRRSRRDRAAPASR